MPRILLLHASVGTGHKRAAEALRLAFESRQPGEVRIEDVLDHTPWLFREAYARSYLQLTNRAPLVWGYFYSQTDADPDLSEITNNVRKIVESLGTNSLKHVLKRFAPDIIVCTHFLPMELLVRLKLKAKLTQPIYCVITDYAAHRFWTYTEIDGYFVATRQTSEQLVSRGVTPSQISIRGIPIDPAFAETRNPAEIRARRNLDGNRPLITLFGGGIATERVRKMVQGLLNSGAEATVVVVAGRNATLASALADLEGNATMDLRVLGFVTYVDDLITTSDLVITKGGGLIISEVLARGIPIVVIDPIPGQEEWNADYVVSNGAGVQLRMAESVPRMACRLLQHPVVLQDMRTAAVSAGRPQAALDIARDILDDFDRKRHN